MIAPLLLQQTPSLEAQVDALLRDQKMPGIVVVVRKQGKNVIKLAKGYSNLETKTKMSLDSVHELASVSKQFTAVSIMRLVDQGKLSLDDSVDKFVADAPETWQKITVKNLLEHTSGLPDYLTPDLKLSEDTSTVQLVQRIKAKPLLFEPGSKWAYSNSGYMVLGHLVERVSGRSFRAFVTDEVITRAGLKTAVVANPQTLLPNRAYGYSRRGGNWMNEAYVSTGLSAVGDGMMMASANDLLQWHHTLMKGGILSKTSWQRMWTPSPQSGNKYGFGFGVERSGDRPRLSHGGAWIGTSTYLMSDLGSDSAIIVLANCDGAPLKGILDSAYQLL